MVLVGAIVWALKAAALLAVMVAGILFAAANPFKIYYRNEQGFSTAKRRR